MFLLNIQYISMAVISIFFHLLFFTISEATATNVGGGRHGFTTSLFHRDSLLSPLHNNNPSLTHYDRLNNAFRRSFSRSAALHNRAAAVIQSPIAPASAEYMMLVSLGTPPVQYIVIADTGSDLTWTQCLPCRQCFNQSSPIFDPKKSSSFRNMNCTSQICRSLDFQHCGDQQICDYNYTYGDNSYTKGGLGFEKITLGSFSVNTIIGCGHETGGQFGISSGIIGLGGGELSLISQMNKFGGVSRQFSYCLPTILSQADGKINFGQDAVVSGPGVVSTPLVRKKPDTYYYITLEAISVGNERHTPGYNTSVAAAQGNVIIDSGTTLTYIPKELYDGVVSSLVKVVKARQVKDPAGYLGLCFAVDDNDTRLDIPIITVHLAGGADVKLLPVNTFTKVADGKMNCLTLVSMSPGDRFGILGNMAQANFLIGHDLESRRLSFKPAVCG